MDFKNATDQLFLKVDHSDLADALGVSVALIRQARLDSGAKAHRAPPKGWEKAVLTLAEKEIEHFQRLAENLRAIATDDRASRT
ncbi:hypothetical protein [Methylocystis sp. Sn-Cys]|uniref:hypothetical protein n=1 Tax=Methylocystis sp. Sn-Cys TaxID=1701263 RepID=UPI001923F226|nr:hypothetical protein [Methylocystis sp. Sn-Cys]MBL1257879.1 hypothetical protein [Methylocystis sp. Sn-Cys]